MSSSDPAPTVLEYATATAYRPKHRFSVFTKLGFFLVLASSLAGIICDARWHNCGVWGIPGIVLGVALYFVGRIVDEFQSDTHVVFLAGASTCGLMSACTAAVSGLDAWWITYRAYGQWPAGLKSSAQWLAFALFCFVLAREKKIRLWIRRLRCTSVSNPDDTIPA